MTGFTIIRFVKVYEIERSKIEDKTDLSLYW